MKEKIRVQLDFASDAYESCKRMQEQLECKDMANVLAKSLRLLEWVLAHPEAKSIALLGKDGQVNTSATRDEILLR